MSKVNVDLGSSLCPVCTQLIEEFIVIDTRIKKNISKSVEPLTGRIVIFSETMCPKCLEQSKQGVHVIEIDESKTTDMNNPYRTGRQWLIADRVFADNKEVLRKRICYVSTSVTNSWKL